MMIGMKEMIIYYLQMNNKRIQLLFHSAFGQQYPGDELNNVERLMRQEKKHGQDGFQLQI